MNIEATATLACAVMLSALCAILGQLHPESNKGFNLSGDFKVVLQNGLHARIVGERFGQRLADLQTFLKPLFGLVRFLFSGDVEPCQQARWISCARRSRIC